ncbi:hypothetical protein CspHIS471_0407820 [Cutaneotrichosporon sp. HIS471]|nr:hypothetical protein CspHIS471_0407820 [Cutaneotrichosporon sp. HIS471]
MTTPSSGYATPDDISGNVLSNGDRVHGSDSRSKPIEGEVLGQAISDVIESLIANMPQSEEGGGLDTVDMDVDSPLNGADNGSPEAGPGPSTSAFREANRHLYSDESLDMNGRFSDGESDDLGPVDEGNQMDEEDEGEEGKEDEDEGEEEEDEDEEEEEDEDDSEQEQLDEVLKVDRGFYDLLVHDLKECIDEAAWTLDLWKRVFVHEYGWSPEPLLDKYGALIEAAVPAFTAKLDRKVLVTTSQPELPTSEAFAQVYQELKAWDWDNPTTRKIDFLHNYKQKYGVMADSVLLKYSGLLKQLVPSYAARMHANIRKTNQNLTSSQMAPKPPNGETQESTNGSALERKSANHTVLPQLPVFSDYLTSQAGSQYKALVTRIRDLGPAIESRLDDMRVVAKDVDQLQAAVMSEWAALQASGAMADVVMDVDGERAGIQAWEYKQAAAVARRSVLLGHRAELDRMREERVKCLAKVRRIDEVVVAARAKIEAALMEE